jgi:hypothetical protein
MSGKLLQVQLTFSGYISNSSHSQPFLKLLKVKTKAIGFQVVTTPLTFILILYNPLLAVIYRLLESLPPKHILAVQPSGTGIFPSFFPVLSNTVTPRPTRYKFPFRVNCQSVGTHFAE